MSCASHICDRIVRAGWACNGKHWDDAVKREDPSPRTSSRKLPWRHRRSSLRNPKICGSPAQPARSYLDPAHKQKGELFRRNQDGGMHPFPPLPACPAAPAVATVTGAKLLDRRKPIQDDVLWLRGGSPYRIRGLDAARPLCACSLCAWLAKSSFSNDLLGVRDGSVVPSRSDLIFHQAPRRNTHTNAHPPTHSDDDASHIPTAAALSPRTRTGCSLLDGESSGCRPTYITRHQNVPGPASRSPRGELLE
ncbi:hypothetical protein GGR56DRAFT_253561 [Xylariaceae sp. FL0804]|nr:hypothetical protein GGR56DRAFT_253561 [Xylariaceae sp. FL0804]